MSAPLFAKDVLFYQRLLKSCSYYHDTLDGIWGRNTTKADDQFQADAARLKDELGTFDSRSEGHIARLHIKAQRRARIFLGQASESPFRCRIISGTRSYEEQNQLYRQGRWGNPGPRVTNARGGESNHNFCIAWDVGLFDKDGNYLTGATAREERAYMELAGLVDRSTLDWGGDWSSFVDRPHYQLRTGRDTSEVRALFEAGQAYV
jgi:peptidoglycan L-alanyl-D-glutamate endopeptidase CwlK